MISSLHADIDECELDTDNCHVNATCTDVIGGFVCTCNSGFEGNGVNCISKKFLCIIAMSPTYDDLSIIVWVDYSYLRNSMHSYRNLSLHADTIDECELDTDNCHVNATCTDVIGCFVCTCNSGLEGNGVNCTSTKFLCIVTNAGNVSHLHPCVY